MNKAAKLLAVYILIQSVEEVTKGIIARNNLFYIDSPGEYGKAYIDLL